MWQPLEFVEQASYTRKIGVDAFVLRNEFSNVREGQYDSRIPRSECCREGRDAHGLRPLKQPDQIT